MKDFCIASKSMFRLLFRVSLITFFFFCAQADGYVSEDTDPLSSTQGTSLNDSESLEEEGDEEESEEENDDEEESEETNGEAGSSSSNATSEQNLREELSLARQSIWGQSLGGDRESAQGNDSDQEEEMSSLESDVSNPPLTEDSGSDDQDVDIQEGWREGKETDVSSGNLVLGSKFSSPLAKPQCFSCGERVVDGNTGDFQFGMASFGLEAGANFPNYSYSTSLGNGSYGTYSSQQGSLGFRLTWEKLVNKNWTAGITGSLRYYFGNLESLHNPIDALSQRFEAQTTQRYELAAKFGRPSGIFSPYIKVGPIVSNFLIKYRDTTFSNPSQKKFIWGGTLGGGLDAEISKGLLMGGLVEYDYYDGVKGTLFNSTGSGRSYKISPTFLNVMLTFTCKLDQYF